MDGFSLGINAATAAEGRASQNFGAIAQVMSTALQVNGQQELQKMKGYQDLDNIAAQGANAMNVQQLQEGGANYRAQLAEQGQSTRATAKNQLDAALKQYEVYNENARTEFSKQYERGTQLLVGQQSGQNALTLAAYNAYQTSMQNLIRNQSSIFTNQTDQGRSPQDARAIALGATSTDPNAMDFLGQFGASPKEMRERGTFQLNLAKGESDIDKNTSEIQRNNFQNAATQAEYGPGGYKDQQMKMDSQKVAAESALVVPHLQQAQQNWTNSYVTMNNGLSVQQKAQELKNMAQLDGLVQQRSAGVIDDNVFQTQSRQVLGNSQISPIQWQELMRVKQATSYFSGIGAGATGQAVTFLPRSDVQQMYQQAPPQAQGIISRIASFITPNVLKEGYGYATTAAGMNGVAPSDDDMNMAFANTYKQVNGKFPTTQAMESFSGSSQAAKVGMLRQAAGNLGPSSDAYNVTQQQDKTNYSVASILLGDAGRGGTGAGNGYGLAGDAVGYAIGGALFKAGAPVIGKVTGYLGNTKIGQAAAGVVGKWFPGLAGTATGDAGTAAGDTLIPSLMRAPESSTMTIAPRMNPFGEPLPNLPLAPPGGPVNVFGDTLAPTVSPQMTPAITQRMRDAFTATSQPGIAPRPGPILPVAPTSPLAPSFTPPAPGGFPSSLLNATPTPGAAQLPFNLPAYQYGIPGMGTFNTMNQRQ